MSRAGRRRCSTCEGISGNICLLGGCLSSLPSLWTFVQALSEEIVAKINAKPHIVVAKRGTCTFGTKATYLAESVGDNAS